MLSYLGYYKVFHFNIISNQGLRFTHWAIFFERSKRGLLVTVKAKSSYIHKWNFNKCLNVFWKAFQLSCFQVLTLLKWLAGGILFLPICKRKNKFKSIYLLHRNPCCMCSCVHVDIYREHHGFRPVFALWFDCRNQEEILSQSLLGWLCQTQLHCEYAGAITVPSHRPNVLLIFLSQFYKQDLRFGFSV